MLYYHTVDPFLLECLYRLMTATSLNSFRLVGGTALSLQIGHRKSVDIDLFTDVTYGSVDFNSINRFLKSHFKYVDFLDIEPALGRLYFVGESKEKNIKLDV